MTAGPNRSARPCPPDGLGRARSAANSTRPMYVAERDMPMEALPAPLALTPVQAAVMALDSYPVGPVNAVRLQRVADVMRQFLGFPRFSVGQMLSAGN